MIKWIKNWLNKRKIVKYINNNPGLMDAWMVLLEREKEMSVLISSRLRKEIDNQGIKLISFKQLHDYKKNE